MPRFFFHLRAARKTLMDCEGVALPDAAAAREQARLTVRDFFQPALGQVHPDWEGWSMEVVDERGRRVFAMAFADAAEIDQPLRAPVQAPPKVVSLTRERTKRELAALENQTRDLVRHTSALVAQNRYEAKSLYGLMVEARDARDRARQTLERSRRQNALQDWSRGEEAVG